MVFDAEKELLWINHLIKSSFNSENLRIDKFGLSSFCELACFVFDHSGHVTRACDDPDQ